MVERENRKGEMLGIVIIGGLFLLMAFTTLAFGTVDPWSVVVFDLASVVLLLLWSIKCVIDQKVVFVLPATAWPLIALFIYGGIQGLSFADQSGKRWSLSMDAEATRLALEVAGCLLISFLIAANFLVGRERLAWFRNFLIFFGLALAVFGMIQHFTWNGRLYWIVNATVPSGLPFGPFVNHNHFAGYLEMIAPIPVALILTRAVRGELSLLYGFAAVIIGVATILSLSRGGMIGLVSGLMFVVIFGLKPGRSGEESSSSRFPLLLSRAGASAVIVVSLAAGVWWLGADSVLQRVEKTELSTQERSAESGKETVFQSRGWIWRDTIALIRENWVTGVGLGAFPTAYPIYSERNGTLIVNQSHNDYLQVVADCGIVGALAAIGFIVLVFRDILRGLRHHDKMRAATALGCGGGVFAMLVHSLFDFNLQLPSNALLFLVLTAVISNISVAAAQKRVENTRSERAPRFRGVSQDLEVWS